MEQPAITFDVEVGGSIEEFNITAYIEQVAEMLGVLPAAVVLDLAPVVESRRELLGASPSPKMPVQIAYEEHISQVAACAGS